MSTQTQTTNFNSILESIARRHGMQTLSDQVNLSLACAGISLEALIDHVGISLDYLTIDEQTVFTMAIMDRRRDGIVSMDFNAEA